MQTQTRKLAAALAAVEQYLEQEAAKAAAQSAALVAANTSIVPRSESGAWAQSGAIDMMAGRRLIQLRAFANRR